MLPQRQPLTLTRASWRALSLTLALFGTLCGLSASRASAQDLTYNLAHNLPNAHRYEGGGVVDLNDLSAMKHLRDSPRSWVYEVQKGDHVGAVPQSVQAHFWFYVDRRLSARDLHLDVALAPGYAKQVMDVFVNGKKIANHNFKSDEWQSARFKVERAQVSEGFAHVKLHFRKRVEIKKGLQGPAVISAVRLAKTSLPELKVGRISSELVSAEGAQLTIPRQHGLDYFVETTKNSALEVAVSAGQLNAWAQTNKGSPKLLKRNITGTETLSLKAFKGAPVRLMLRAPKETTTFSASLSDAPPMKTKSSKKPELTKPKYVVFWLIDTLRADKLPFYQQRNSNGRKKVKTPHLSALAEEAMVVEPFYVQGNESKASHASLFTGTYPIKHGVYTEAAKLPKKLFTIAELFKSEGYLTGGYVSNGYVSDRWDFDQGFTKFQNFIREGKANNAQAVVKAAKRFVKRNKKKPFYLYLGTSDPHVTYRRHKDFIDDYSPKGYSGRFTKYLSGAELGKLKGRKPPKRPERARIEALYENEIAFNDHHFGELIKTLKEEGIYEDTMIIVSADHGDEFWEHGSCGHGHSLYQELVSVPLMVRWPAAFPQGRFEGGAEGVDLMPTLLELLGGQLPKGATVQGESLLPHMSAKAGYPQARMASMGTERFTLAIDQSKVVFRGRGAIESFDLQSDRKEAKDLSSSDAVLTLSTLDPLMLYLSRPRTWNKASWGAPNALREGFPKGFPRAWKRPTGRKKR